MEPKNELAWVLLERVATGSDLEVQQIVESDEFDLATLLEGAARHKLLPALAEIVDRLELESHFPGALMSSLRVGQRVARYQGEVFTTAAVEINDALESAGVPVAWTKGVVLQHTVYPSMGTRLMADIDMMVPFAYRDGVVSVLETLGYSFGQRYDRRSHQLVPLPREQSLLYTLWPDHLPHFHRITDDAIVPLLTIDVAHSFTWHESRWRLPLDVAFDRLGTIELSASGSSKRLPILSAPYSFMFVCLHLFREGWFERSFRKSDVSLSQFGDVVRCWTRLGTDEQRQVLQSIRDFDLQLPFAWVIGHTDLMFGTVLADELLLSESVTEEWLETASGVDGSIRRWDGEMRNRIRGRGAVALR